MSDPNTDLPQTARPVWVEPARGSDGTVFAIRFLPAAAAEALGIDPDTDQRLFTGQYGRAAADFYVATLLTRLDAMGGQS